MKLWRWVLPSFADIFFIVFLVILTLSPVSAGLLGDADTGWHIRAGEQIIATHKVPRTDPFSYTRQGEPWYAWEWLYDLPIAAVHSIAGLNGVLLVTAAVIGLTFALLFHFTLRRSGNLAVAALLTLLACGAAQVHMLARPHVLTWLLALLWAECLLRFTEGQASALLWLPLLMVLWVNLHAGFVLGLLLLAIFAVEPTCRRDGHRVRQLAAISLLCLLTTFITPYGYRLHLHVYQYLSNSFFMNNIDEFRSPDFHQSVFLYFAAFVPLSMAGAVLGRARLKPTHLILWLFSMQAGLYAVRNIPIAAILITLVLGPLLSGRLPAAPPWLRSLLSELQAISDSMARLDGRLRGHLMSTLCLAALLALVWNGGRILSMQVIHAHFDEKTYPARAADFIAQSGIRDRLFSSDTWGAYLIYRLSPGFKVYFDDRHDFYGEAFVKDYRAVVSGERRWGDPLDRYRVQWVLMPVDAPLSSLLRESQDWRIAYHDDLAILFSRAGH